MSYTGQLRQCCIALGFTPNLYRNARVSGVGAKCDVTILSESRRLRFGEIFVVLHHYAQRNVRRSATGHYLVLLNDGLWYVRGKFIEDASDLLKRP